MRRSILFHGKRHTMEMGEAEIGRFLSSLALEGKVSASTQNQALSALLFLYKEVLGREIAWIEGVVRARAPRRLPVVLTRDEVRSVFLHMRGTPKLIALLLNGAGMRVLIWHDIWRSSATSTGRTCGVVPGGLNSPAHSPASTRWPGGSGDGNGSSRPRGPTSIPLPVSAAGITSTRRSCSGR